MGVQRLEDCCCWQPLTPEASLEALTWNCQGSFPKAPCGWQKFQKGKSVCVGGLGLAVGGWRGVGERAHVCMGAGW